MQASIDFDGTLTGSIAGGGGGGSDVSITPTYNQGTKIADYSIDGNEGAIYTPEIEISKNVLSGVKICEIEGVEIYCPSYGYIDTLGDSNVEQIGGFSEGANVTPVKVKRVSYTNDVSNGEKIGSLTVGDTSYDIKQTIFNLDGHEHLFGKISNNAYVYYKYVTTDNIPANNWDAVYDAGYPILFILGNVETSNGVKWGLNYSVGSTYFNYYINGSEIVVNWGGYSSNNTVANLLIFYVRVRDN